MSVGERLIAGRRVRWDSQRADRAYVSGLWIRETLVDALRDAARETPDRVLILDGEHRLDCQSLQDQAGTLAQAMLARAPAGSVVSFMLPNWHEAAVIYMAATMAGMVANPILPSLRDRDLAFILQDVDARFIFAPANFRNHDYAGMLSRITAEMSAPPEVIIVRGDAGPHTPYAHLFEIKGPTRALPVLDPDAVRLVMFTSGTTGRPKGVLHSHNTMHALIRQLGDHWIVDPGDRLFIPSPISHMGGSIYAFEYPLLLGTSAVLMDVWNPDEAVRLVDEFHCTHMGGATPFLDQTLAAARRAGSRLPSLKLFICGGASVPPSLVREATAQFQKAIVTRVYGSTEVPVAAVGSMTPGDVAHAADTDGRIGISEVKLIDRDGKVADEGEIYARGPQMLVGFLHPEDEAKTFDADGFYKTGDLARWVDGEYLVIIGRAKDIIIRNGENISPKEVEDILVRHPDIAEVAIVGLPDRRTGERACAVIVPKHTPGPDVTNVRTFLETQGIATFKVPEQVVIWESLPKNDTGKVLKDRIRAAITAASQEM